MAGNDQNAAQVYLDTVNNQLSQERTRREALEQRGVTVTSTSATLAALLFTLAGLSLKDGKFHLPGASRYVLVAAILLFVTAAVLGLFATIHSRGYREMPITLFREWMKSASTDDASAATLATIGQLVNIIGWARTENGKKASAVKAALWIEFAAVVLLACAVAYILVTVG
jgi:hypothetical protein